MNSLKIKKNDKVVVLSGKDKGKSGKVLGTVPSERKVVVEGINVVTCHIKPRKQGEEGGIVKREAAIYASKVQVVCPKCDKPTRVAYEIKAVSYTHLDVYKRQFTHRPIWSCTNFSRVRAQRLSMTLLTLPEQTAAISIRDGM